MPWKKTANGESRNLALSHDAFPSVQAIDERPQCRRGSSSPPSRLVRMIFLRQEKKLKIGFLLVRSLWKRSSERGEDSPQTGCA